MFIFVITNLILIQMKIKSLLSVLLLFSASSLFAWNNDIIVSTPNTSLLLNAPKGGELKIVYFGEKIDNSEISQIYDSGIASHRAAYPVFGIDCQTEPALSVTHPDGNMSLDLEISDVTTAKESNATITTVTMKDKVYPFIVKINYKAYNNTDIIETWSEITNNEKKPVLLRKFASGYLPIRKGDVWLSHLYGSWADEGRLVQEELTPGMKVIKNKDGVRNSTTDHGEIMFSLDGKPQENSGKVIGAALCWSGNYKLSIDTDNNREHQFMAGINEENSEYKLTSKETFVTPELALTFSNEGLSGVSRNFHRWARVENKLHNGKKLRDILLNSWEGVYFDINEKGMDQMMGDISSMGGELFVMDDGWFGVKYPRKDDRSSLGDWTVDKNKLPNGVPGLVEAAKKHGIKFGIWIEPEMTNTVSELYEKHPDWVIHQSNRPLRTGRGGSQLVLDVSNPKVQDFIFSIVDNLMKENPDLYYIKWDANMSVANWGSSYLTADKQSHLMIDYHRGLRKVLERIRAKYPDLVIQACASGGGRATYGVLPYFDEFWVSDDTDALQRIYMQWGTSYFFPSNAMASHVSAAPNHQTGRIIPIKFRFDVAMTARLGMEIQPKNMTDKEKEFSKKAIEGYKQIRPIVQQGELYRLISPYDKKGVSSLMYTTEDKSQAVFFAYKLEHFCNQSIPRFTMKGLNPDKTYMITEMNVDGKPVFLDGKKIKGSILMNQGVELPLNSEYSSRVLKLTAL